LSLRCPSGDYVDGHLMPKTVRRDVKINY
jgi:hypothetical protein